MRKIRIGEHIKITPGFPFNSALFNNDGDGLPLIRIRDLLASKINTYYKGEFPKEYLIEEGDILIGMDGDFHIVKWKNKTKALLNQRIMKVAQKEGAIISIEFFYYFLFPFLSDIWEKTTATTVKHLSTYDVAKQQGKNVYRIVNNTVEATANATDEAARELLTKYLAQGDISQEAYNQLINKQGKELSDGLLKAIDDEYDRFYKALTDNAGAGVKGAGSVFNHVPTSGVIITSNAKQGTFLVGSYPLDLQYILGELNYPKIQTVDFNFPVPSGQKFNLLNISDEAYNYWAANGGFFTKVNGPWIDAAVTQGADIVVVSKMETLYNSPGVLSGFGKEIHRLEWKHGYRYNPATKTMVPPSQANGLPAKTLQSEYTHN